MSAFNSKTALVAILAALSGPVVFTACGPSSNGEESASVGTLSVPLTTTGSDGVSYRFPVGTRLTLSGMNYWDEFPLDGEGSVLSVRLPAGTFTVGVTFPSVNAQLERVGTDGTLSLVNAQWVDTQPVSVTIAAGASSSLVLNFRVTGLDDVVFSMGTLEVSVAVSHGQVATATQVVQTGTYTNGGLVFGASTSAEAQSALSMTPGQMQSYVLRFGVIDGWAQYNAEMICATVSVGAFEFDSEFGIARALRGLSGGQGSLCVIDEGAQDQVFVSADRLGATTAELPGLPGTNYRFFMYLGGRVGDVYDGAALDQSVLEAPTTMSDAILQHQIWDYDPNAEVSYSWGTVVGTVQLTP